jgi:glycosyltransferase involved in cell wall biosynthesis
MPTYNARKTLPKALASIASQAAVDKAIVTVVDDCSTESYDDIIDTFKRLMKIRMIRTPENGGCGVARQYGIDNTECDCFTFLDADDTLMSSFALGIMVKYMNQKNCDILVGNFLEEVSTNLHYIHRTDRTWMHGKLYRTKFIKNNDVRFNLSRRNEDSAFNTIAFNCTNKVLDIDYTVYIWHNNRSSITRTGNYLGDSMSDYINNALYAYYEIQRRGATADVLNGTALSTFCNLYGYYILFLNNKEGSENITNFLSTAKNYFVNTDLAKVIESCDKQLLAEMLYASVYKDVIEQKIIIPVTFDHFIEIVTGSRTSIIT